MSPIRLTDALRATLPAILATGLTAVADGPTTKSKWTTAVYLLQEAYKAPLGYRFTLYVSGPHAPGPEMDLLSAKEHGLVLFDQNPGDHRYSILPGPQAQYAAAITGVWSPYMAGMRSLIRSLGPLTSSELNLRATTHYMFHSNNPPPPSEHDLTAAVHELKPQVLHRDIRKAVKHLKDLGLIKYDQT